jgi:dienelactone hydrolase
MIVRSVHFGFNVPDTDASIATLYYPADEGSLDAARLTGLVAADRSHAPWPLVIMLPGINVTPDSYRWLAIRLVQAGYCAATYASIGSLGPAGRGITPGMDMAAFGPDMTASRCSATALGPLLDAIADLDEPVQGLIDFDRVAIGGHSAGGTIALHNTDPSWVPGLVCAFGFGGHTMTSMSLGHNEASVTAVPSKVPILLLTGADDGVVAASRDRYRTDDQAHDPVQRTFDEAIRRNQDDSWIVELTDGNHFTICDPIDETSGRSFLEAELRSTDSAARDTLALVLLAFLGEHCQEPSEQDRVEDLVNARTISRWARR